MHGAGDVATFGRESSFAVLQAACERTGLDPEGAELLRLGENAIYRLHSTPIVVRIARNMDQWADATKEVAVSQWLAEMDVQVVRACDREQPIDVQAHPVTFWGFIEGRRGRPGDVRQLGALLRRIHELPVPTALSLPGMDPLRRVAPRIERAPISDSDRAFLVGLLDELSAELPRLRFPLGQSVVHGDAHVQNLMVSERDGTTLIDLENVAVGQPEWDLTVTATEFVTAGFWTDEQYKEFVDSYGFDVTEWSGFEVLRRTQEIKMTTWLMQNVNESGSIRDEYELRMRAIRSNADGQAWQPF